MQIPNNPAGRLLNIVNRLKAVKGDKKAGLAWAEVLEVSSSDLPILLHRYGEVLNLCYYVLKTIQKQNVDRDLYYEPVHSILNAFKYMNFEAAINNTQNRITDVAINGLKFCDELLSRHSPEKTLDEKNLKSILESIWSLIEEVKKSDVDEYLKQYLL
ncbi:hypothetical protein ACFL02_10425, partial [Planctomycetota bacterium]